MKKLSLVMLVIIVLCLVGSLKVNGLEVQGDPFNEPTVIRCTCYTDHGTTASGKETRNGVVAGRKEWLGYVACIYAMNKDGSIGEFIGYYEFLDTGAGIDTDGDGKGDSIKNGTSIDVWLPDNASAKDWQSKYGDYVYIKIVEGVG